MDTNTTQRIQDVLAKNEKVGIVTGKNPTIDEMGASLALSLALQSLGKQVSIASPTDPIVEVSSLVGIDKVRTSLDGSGGDLIVSFPYRDDEIQKVSYTIDNGYLNIVVKAGEQGLSFTEKDVVYRRGGGVPTLLFVIGTPNLSDLGQLFNPEAFKQTTLINIDNKANNQGYGDIVLVSQEYSSVSEQVGQLLHSLGVTLDIDVAQNLFSGISYATDNFQKPKTSYIAFEMAGKLLRLGAHRTSSLKGFDSKQADRYFPPQPSGQRPQQPSNRSQPQTSQPVSQFGGPAVTQPVPQQQAPRPQQQQSQPVSQQQQGARPQQNMQPAQPPLQQFHQPSAPQQGGQPQRSQEEQDKKGKNPPPDWLMPKVYRGSTNI